GAVGVGITMTLPMDIRLASNKAKIGFVFARRGLAPEAGAASFLPRIVGLPQALRWCYSGKVFGADEALAGGLVSEVTEPDDLLPRAVAIAREIADETSAISIAVTRALLWRFSDEADPLKVLGVDGALAMAMGGTADVKEGVAAFLEKRKPNFPGKVSTDMPDVYPWWA
ncbi:MAG TPA: enoyl-CoA hydratase-related protein, partial [Caulobacter sp.]|nr:enoyl-CoA hydratase-related protein [Caulobacter sp.]